MGTVDDQLAALDPQTRAAVQAIVDLALTLAPDAEQGTSYGLPALRWHGKPMVAVSVATRHCSLVPFSPTAVAAAGDRMPAADLSKGTIRFTPDAPLPPDVVRDVLQARMTEIGPPPPGR
jgi:uncharacterized protein YdhG (YjbR/CyaY superfamily)